MKTALKLVGYIVAFLLMAAGLIAIVMYIIGMGDPDNDFITHFPGSEPTPVVETSATPAPSNTPYIAETPTPYLPTPTPTPEPTPSPTPAPTPTPVPDPPGTPLGGGTFSSDTGVWIDLDAVWSAETVNSDKVKITVVANLRSYSLYIGEGKRTLLIEVDGQNANLDVKAMQLDTDSEVTTELGTFSFEVDAPKGYTTKLPLAVTWQFGGVYSGQQLDKITASGEITLNR